MNMSRSKNDQKLIAFTKNSQDLEPIKADMKEGWNIVSLMKNGNYYVGIMELNSGIDNETVFIPPRKKIKISSR